MAEKQADHAEKLFRIQKQVREDSKTVQSYLTDLQNWEIEMKRKEAALKGQYEQDLPPIRSKISKKKEIKIVETKPEKRISSFDYKSWDNFDVDKACEAIDMADVGPSSLDSKKSEPVKKAKLNEEAIYEKERGNQFVKQSKWDEAIQCYNRAIEIDNRDAIYYANRGLCYLKLEKLHKAESDCTEALRLDPTYVKALLRRATAREQLGSLKSASEDLVKVLAAEPHNAMARKQLAGIRERMGSKGSNLKTSPLKSPTDNKSSLNYTGNANKIQEISKSKEKTEPKVLTPLERWCEGIDEGITVIKPVKKPPHLRSKTPLKQIEIKEIPLGHKTPMQAKPNKIQIVEVESQNHGDTLKNTNENITNMKKPTEKGDMLTNGVAEKSDKEKEIDNKVIDRIINNDNVINKASLVPPSNSVQFMVEWRNLKDVSGGRSDYLSIIDPSKIPVIFDNSLESDILSSVLHSLAESPCKFQKHSISAYLKGLAETKRFSTLVMFLSTKDKHLVNNLLVQVKTAEGCSEEMINDLKNKFEI